MKYIKKFETITNIKVGDYILIPDYEARILSWKHQELGTFLKKQVLQVYKIVTSNVLVEVKNVPKKYYGDFFYLSETGYPAILIEIKNITHISENRDELQKIANIRSDVDKYNI